MTKNPFAHFGQVDKQKIRNITQMMALKRMVRPLTPVERGVWTGHNQATKICANWRGNDIGCRPGYTLDLPKMQNFCPFKAEPLGSSRYA